jgi:PPK2 family polyphosphate:nucleotide phosphotransferase
MSQPILIPPGTRVRLGEFDPDDTGGYDKEAARAETEAHVKRLGELQEVLWAEKKHAALILLQAMDAGGKDGAIRNVLREVNPQGCQVTNFRVPTQDELEHDFLWRIHRAVPAKGMIGVFNRSQYEDVLVVRVHNLVPEEVWKARYKQINRFEKLLARTGTTIVKFYLHISKDEQKRQFEERLHDPAKNWKFAMGDLKEREYWDDYMRAYEVALSRCSTEWAPWHVVPSNHRWYRDLVISRAVVQALEKLDLRYPAPPPDLDKVVIP